VESSALTLDESAMLTQSGVCEESTGLGDVTQELKFRVKSFVERLENIGTSLDRRRRCYKLIDKVAHLQFIN